MRQMPYLHASDEQLLAAAGSEPRAFGVFYDRYEALVLGFLYRATRRADIAADLTAEVFAAALESISQFDRRRGSARAWLFGIARHELADTWARGRVEDRARRRLGLEPISLADPDLERIAELGADRAIPLLDELPEEQREAITGRVLEQRDYAELASALQCSPSVVRQRVSRGLRALKAKLEEAK